MTSLVLEKLLIERVEARLGPLPLVRAGLHDADAAARHGARDRAAAVLGAELLAFAAGDEPRERRWLARVGQLAFERLLGEAVTPPLRVGLLPLDESGQERVLPGRFNHAVICGELPGFANELFPLILDAYAHDLAGCGALRINVLGVHRPWLDSRGRATRAIFYAHASGELHERDLAHPTHLDSVHLLCLGEDEREVHAALCADLSRARQLNPHAGALRADHKAEACRLWVAAGIPTPATVRLPRPFDPDAVRERLTALPATARGRGLIVQPETGTEGHGVRAFEAWSGPSLPDGLLDHVRALQASGDAIARARVPGLRYREGHADFSADLRVNVAWDGARYQADSGYLQVAADPAAIASSVGRGGRIVKLSEGALDACGLDTADLAGIRAVAAAAAAALASGLSEDERLLLVGLDLKLERRPDGIMPWVLDANPRPAGLSYSELFDSGEPGVASGLWGHLIGGS